MTTYDVGDRVQITTTFTDLDGTPTSPDTLYADYLKPGATEATELTPSDEGSGVVTTLLPAFDVGGVWRWYVKGTAGVIAADQGDLVVRAKGTGADV